MVEQAAQKEVEMVEHWVAGMVQDLVLQMEQD